MEHRLIEDPPVVVGLPRQEKEDLEELEELGMNPMQGRRLMAACEGIGYRTEGWFTQNPREGKWVLGFG